MQLKQRLFKGAAISATALSLAFAPLSLEQPMGPPVAYAQKAGAGYDPSADPFEAGTGIRAMAAQGATAKELHRALAKKLRASSSGETTRDDRAPRTAEQALKSGGDCTEFTYAGIALFRSKGIESGALVLKAGKSLNHVLQWAESEGKREIIDPQTGEFGKGRMALQGGKTISFDYGGAVKKLGARVLDANQAAGLYHMEWGNYFKDQKGKESEAISAFKKALEINPDDAYSGRQLSALQGKFVNRQMDLGVKAYNSRDFRKALAHFQAALGNFPANASQKNREQLAGLISQCQEMMKNQE